MNVSDVLAKYPTDKHTTHSYDVVYNELFKDIRLTATAILEIGVASGGSVRAWRDYFENALIIGVDIDSNNIFQEDRIITINADQRDTSTLQSLVVFTSGGFDVVIDDGSHDIGDQLTSLKSLWGFVKRGGLYIIEDIQNIEHADLFDQFNDASLTVADRRSVKGRYDDIMVILRKD